jgi:hypothetical protein
MIVTRWILLRVRNVSEKNVQTKSKHTVLRKITLFFQKIVLFMRQCRKNKAEPGRPQMTTEYGASALRAG